MSPSVVYKNVHLIDDAEISNFSMRGVFPFPSPEPPVHSLILEPSRSEPAQNSVLPTGFPYTKSRPPWRVWIDTIVCRSTVSHPNPRIEPHTFGARKWIVSVDQTALRSFEMLDAQIVRYASES